MTEHSIMVDLNDARTSEIAEILSNKTCKKILSLLAEKEMSAGDIASELGMPLNTVGYNLEKLMGAGLIEKSKEWFWSAKGKKIPTYKISNKRIVISPKNMIKGILPAVLITGAIAFGIKMFIGAGNIASDYATPALQAGTAEKAVAGVATVSSGASQAANVLPNSGSGGAFGSGVYSTLMNAPNSWAWFFLGALVALLIFLLWNWRKKT